MSGRDREESFRSLAPGLTPWQWWLGAWVLGLFAAGQPWPSLVGLVLLAVPAQPRLPSRFFRAAFMLCFLLGWAVGAFTAPGPAPPLPEWMAQRRVVDVSGVIRDVDTRPGGRFRLIVDDLAWELDQAGGDLPGVLVLTWKDPEFSSAPGPAPGRTVRFRGRVKPVRGFVNFDSWNSRDWWARRDVRWRSWVQWPSTVDLSGEASWAWKTRYALRRAVLEHSPEGPGRALVLALALGDRSTLDQDTVDLFRRAGLAHSLALSGLHLGMVASSGWLLAWLVGLVRPGIFLIMPRQRLAVILAAPFTLAYVWLGGATPSLVRAAIMLACFGWLLLRGRERVVVDGLFAALALILVLSPGSVHDIRLQFSALAVGGMAWGLPPLWRGIRWLLPGPGWRRPARAMILVLATTLTANLALLPLTAQSFGRLPLDVLPNVVWLPVLALAVMPLSLAGMVLCAVGAAVPGLAWLGQALLWAAASLSDWFVQALHLVDVMGGLPEAVVLRPGWAGLAGYYALAAVLLWVVTGRGKAMPRRAAMLALAGLCLLAVPQLGRAVDESRDRVRLIVLDTGQSQAVLVEGPDGVRALLDGGGGWSDDFDLGRAVTVPAITAGRPPRLDLACMSHPDRDHAQGLVDVAEHMDVARFGYNGQWPEHGLAARLPGLLAERGVPVADLSAGDVLYLGPDGGPDLQLQVMHPPRGYFPAEDNDDSLVLRLVWRGHGLALVPGDVEAQGLAVLLETTREGGRDLSADLLVLPHHGSKSSLCPDLYAWVHPRLAVAAVGFLNPFGHPHPDVVRAVGVPVLSTGDVGAIELTWDDPESPPMVRTADNPGK